MLLYKITVLKCNICCVKVYSAFAEKSAQHTKAGGCSSSQLSIRYGS